MPEKKSDHQLKVQDFTGSVAPLIELINTKLNTPGRDGKPRTFCVSDVVDKNGKRYVDLVLEGGGVLGVALAGYTYVLEKMGLTFMKMAGTSAGSINLLFLNAVTTRNELKLLKENALQQPESSKWDAALRYNPAPLKEEDYYDTRSEKMLEYLSVKPLSDLVDGNINWRNILLGTFQGKVDFHLIKSYLKKLGMWAALWAACFLLLFLTGTGLALLVGSDSWTLGLRWAFCISAGAFLVVLGYLLMQAMKGKMLIKFAGRFGINPGEDLEKWAKDVLEKNGIFKVSHLKSKLQQEYETLQPAYKPCCQQPDPHIFPAGATLTEVYSAEMADIVSRINELDPELRLQMGKVEPTEIETDLDDLAEKLIFIARKAAPGAQDHDKTVDQLLYLFTRVNELRYDYKALWSKEQGTRPRAHFAKEIAMVASDLTNQIKVEFPAMHKMYWGENFDISPARYIRASMSIPFFYQPFRVDYDPGQRDVMEQEWRRLLNMNKRFEGNDKYALMMDGGMLSNFPVDIFYNSDTPLPTKPTIGVKLQFEDDARSTHIESMGALVGSMISTMRYFYDRDFSHKHNMFKKTVRSIDTGDISWLNFALTEQEQVELFFRGALTAAIFLLGSEEKSERATDIQHLKMMGKNVKLRGKEFSIYEGEKEGFFQTEDNNLDDVFFDWCAYKRARVEALGESKSAKNTLKTKAGFTQNT